MLREELQTIDCSHFMAPGDEELLGFVLPLVCGLGNFLDLKQTDYVFLDTVNSGVISHQKMSKDAVFPESTK